VAVPELPEVETIRRQLAPRLAGRRFREAGSHESSKFTPAREVTGAGVVEVGRRGKYLMVELDDGRDLVVHLGMTGQLRSSTEPDDLDDPYLRAWWELDDGSRLLFRDVRRFGRIHVIRRGHHDAIPTLRDMGPEPFDLSFDGRQLWERMRGRRRLKTQLLSQRPVAGVGNIYADEALFGAGINPALRRISVERATVLLAEIRRVLELGLDRGGTTLRDYRSMDGEGSNQFHLACYGRAGEECFRCGGELRGRVIDARSTTWCPVCQT